MPRRKHVVPKISHHRPTGQARIRVAGRSFYLGKYDARANSPTKEASKNYAHLLHWLQVTDDPPKNWKELDPDQFAKATDGQSDESITIIEVLAKYVRHAKGYYRESNEFDQIKYAIKPLRELFGEMPACKFGPVALEQIRDKIVADGLTRQGANKRVTKIRRVFRWAVANELIPPGVAQALESLAPLKAGRTDAPEAKQTECVSDADIDAVEPYVLPQVWSMIQLQRFSGMRPGEVTRLRMCDIDSSGDTWVYRPSKHKNLHRGQSREIYLGARAQAVLNRWIRDDNRYLFSPREAVEWQRQQRSLSRRTPKSCGNRGGTNRRTIPQKQPGDVYTVHSYRGAIKRACKKAGIPPWSPNQIRHTVGTQVRKKHGLEAAQVVLGHKRVDATQLYAEPNRALAVQVIQELT